MPEFSVSVALFDLLPVTCSALATTLLAQAISRRHAALAGWVWLGATLVVCGGLCKAIWKLLVALEIGDYAVLNNALFVLLAPGLALLAYGLIQTRHAGLVASTDQPIRFSSRGLGFYLGLLALASLGSLILWPGTRAWFFILLGATTLANLVLVIQAILLCRRERLPNYVSACFVYNMTASLALGGLARLPTGEASAWIQESVNLSAQIALALGCWHLNQSMKKDTQP